jgi:hypothetical protein
MSADERDIREIEPTEMACRFVFHANGGVVRRGDKADRVREATVNAFQTACEAEGLDYNAEVKCVHMKPANFDRWATKKFGATA